MVVTWLVQPIDHQTNIQTVIWLMDQNLDRHLVYGRFDDWTTFDHLNTHQVRYSDPHSIYVPGIWTVPRNRIPGSQKITILTVSSEIELDLINRLSRSMIE